MNFDEARGWEQTQPGWYEYDIKFTGLPEEFDEFNENVLDWMYSNIDNPNRHMRWAVFPFNVGEGVTMKFKFRFEKDYIWFKLRF